MKRAILFFGLPVLCYLLLSGTDKLYGFKYPAVLPKDSVTIEQGDIIFCLTLNTMADYGLMSAGLAPGHVAIAMNTSRIANFDTEMKGLQVAESCLFNRKKKSFQAALVINPAADNFGHARGRRFLFKMHLTNQQKDALLECTKKWEGAPYRLFINKNDTVAFNCSSYVWQAFKYATAADIDNNGGRFVLPADILKFLTNKPEAEMPVRF